MEPTPILVTGGCGFLGTAIIQALLSAKGFAITAVDINPPSLGSASFTADVRYVRCDVLDSEAVRKTWREARPALVIHTVGVYPLGVRRYSMKGCESVFAVNVEGTRNVLAASRECGARGLVFTSSIAAVLDELSRDFKNVDERWPAGGATTSYGMSKVDCCLLFAGGCFHACNSSHFYSWPDNPAQSKPSDYPLAASSPTAYRSVQA